MAAALTKLLGGFAGVLVFKEVADFVQIGMVAYQTGKRFQQQRALRGGVIGIDGGTVRVQVDGASFTLPIEDAAALAGVAGVAGKGTRAQLTERERVVAARYLSPATVARVESGEVPQTGQRHVAVAGEQGSSVAGRPNPDNRPFTARDFVEVQEQGKFQRQGFAVQAERQLALLQQDHAARLAAQTDLRLREQMALQFAGEERQLEVRVQLARERAASEERLANVRFGHQLALDDADREWKGVQSVADRAWRERTSKEATEIADYRKNLAADLAVGRQVETARKLREVLQSGLGRLR